MHGGATTCPLWEAGDGWAFGFSHSDPRSTSLSANAWKSVLEIDLYGTFFCSQAVLPVMRAQGGGRIVNVTSVFARLGRVIPSRIGTKHASSGLRAYLDSSRR